MTARVGDFQILLWESAYGLIIDYMPPGAMLD